MMKPKPRVICSAIFVGLLATVQSQADEKSVLSVYSRFMWMGVGYRREMENYDWSLCRNPRSTDEPQAASNAGFHQYEPTPGPDTASRGIHSDYELASDPAGHYSTPHPAPDRAAVNAGTRGQHGDASSSYNELSFEAQRPKQGARTYDHLKQ
ncbi:hypothetical protein BaRGS_00018607 [Batillaria attramentaria]|uniref:Uncharacterized protein n=1 Tax=Batillaria attramentaria TaxID=370345 RepID=A0ABD0KSG1_9CAEN